MPESADGHPVVPLMAPSADRMEEFLAAVHRSRDLHTPWVSAPDTPAAFLGMLERFRTPAHIGYWAITGHGALAGVVTFSEIVRGAFQSAYLGYYAFVPHHRQGHMTRSLGAALSLAFGVHQLHRVEANIQPGNEASKALVRGLGFRLEGLSPRYLKIGGDWRDHERWALTAEEWVPPPATRPA